MWKQPNSVLVGDINPDTGEPAYRTKVKYWMQVTSSGVGFHDATWQTAFGGTLYQIPGTGSHGCINMPLGSGGGALQYDRTRDTGNLPLVNKKLIFVQMYQLTLKR